MHVAVLTVGDELLAGDTVNTNAAWLGQQLTERGARVKRIVVVPDTVQDIAQVVNELRADFEAVIVTGGVGPTHDDVTLEGVAAAVGTQLEEHPAAIEWFETQSNYTADNLAEGTTNLPAGSRLIPNDVGVAPGAVVEGTDGVPIYVLPGVPEEMKQMFSRIADEFSGERLTRISIESDEPESALIDRLAEVRDRFDVSVGSYPGESVSLTIQGVDGAEVRDAAEWLRDRV